MNPVAFLARPPAGALAAGPALSQGEPFIACAHAVRYCGPLCSVYPCVNADPTDTTEMHAEYGCPRVEFAPPFLVLTTRRERR